MNTLTKAETAVIVPAPNSAASLVVQRPQQFDLSPQTFEQALIFADYLAASDMVPKVYRGRPGDCLIAMQWGYEIGLKPLQALQSIATINGKPGLFGDAGKAILLSQGCIIEEDDIAVIKQTGMGRCKITRPGRPPTERTFSVNDAETAGLWKKEGPWKTYPWRQMAWRAFWFAARDAASDLLRGLSGAEELADYQPDAKSAAPTEPPPPSGPPPYPDDKFAANLLAWLDVIAQGRKTADQIIGHIKTRNTLTAEQEQQIRAGKPVDPAAQRSDAPAVSAADVLAKMDAAQTVEELDTAAGLIAALPEAERAGLNDHYDDLRDRLTQE